MSNKCKNKGLILFVLYCLFDTLHHQRKKSNVSIATLYNALLNITAMFGHLSF